MIFVQHLPSNTISRVYFHFTPNLLDTKICFLFQDSVDISCDKFLQCGPFALFSRRHKVDSMCGKR